MCSKFTGLFQCFYGVQSRTLQKVHPDQHWVNALMWSYLKWLIEIYLQCNQVAFVGQDDKAKTPVGGTVPISTGVRANNSGIVAVGDEARMKALDHEFHVGNITPSVTLLAKIPDSIAGSFFIGNEDGEGGDGQTFVTL